MAGRFEITGGLTPDDLARIYECGCRAVRAFAGDGI